MTRAVVRRVDPAEEPARTSQLVVSRRASDAIRARAAELHRGPISLLEVVIKAGLEAFPSPYPDEDPTP